MKDWKYYNHAMIPTTPPHVKVNTRVLEEDSFWKEHKGALLARWTEDYDTDTETHWWYVIKDTPFDLAALKAKRRYEINRGNKNFDVLEITPSEYSEDIYEVATAAYEKYPKKYRPQIDKDRFISGTKSWDYYKAYGAFHRESGKLCGYALLNRDGDYIDFCVQKAIPSYESLSLNAAIVYKILEDHKEFLGGGGYICDGARNLVHETAFQDWLIKNFEFRRAYCRLNIAYAPKVGGVVKLLFPFRKLLRAADGIKIISQINAVLKMEEIYRLQKKQDS